MNKIDIPQVQSIMAVIFTPITGAIAIAVISFNYITSISHWILGCFGFIGALLGVEAVGGACCYALIKCHREKDYGADFYTALAGTIAYIAGGILTLYLTSPIVIFFALSPFAYFSYSIIRIMIDEVTAKTEETEAQVKLINAQKNLINAQNRRDKARSDGTIERFERLEQESGPLTKKSPEWKDLRVWIWERDDKTCQKCGVDLSDGHYHCHHIVPEFMGGKTEPNNLTTICGNCHIELHGGEQDGHGRGMAKLRERTLQQQAEKSANLEMVLSYLADNPGASLGAIGDYVGSSKATAKNYTDELIQAGRLHKNGQGWKVKE